MRWPAASRKDVVGPVEIDGEGVTHDQVSMELYGVPWASGTLRPRDRDNILHNLVGRNRPVGYAAWQDSYIDPGEAALIIAAEVSGVADARRCFGHGDQASCAWLGAGLIPINRLAKLGHGIHAIDKARDATRAYCSFSAETEVLMADGTTRPISEIEPGDQVLATDPATGEQSPQTVTAVWVHEDTLVALQVRQPEPGLTRSVAGELMVTVTTTADHPFWNTTDQQWQPASTLDPGDQLLTDDGAVPASTVIGLLPYTQRSDTAYNLTITGPHTYFALAGDTPFLVHNAGCWSTRSERAGDLSEKYTADSRLGIRRRSCTMSN